MIPLVITALLLATIIGGLVLAVKAREKKTPKTGQKPGDDNETGKTKLSTSQGRKGTAKIVAITVASVVIVSAVYGVIVWNMRKPNVLIGPNFRIGIITLSTEFDDCDLIELDAADGENIIVVAHGTPFVGETLVNGTSTYPLNLDPTASGKVLHESIKIIMYNVRYRALKGSPQIAYCIYKGGRPPPRWYNKVALLK